MVTARADIDNSPDVADRVLVERARVGDRQAFGALYQRHVDRVYSFIVFRVRDESQAEDLTQEAFVQALRGLQAFEWQGSIAPWLLRIARNTVIDHWRRRARHPDRPLSATEVGEEEDEDRMARVASEDGIEALLRAEAMLDWTRVVEASSQLTELQQQVLALRFAAGLSVRDTAMAMDRSEGAVKNLQHHALKALRRHMDEDVS